MSVNTAKQRWGGVNATVAADVFGHIELLNHEEAACVGFKNFTQ